MMFASMCTLFTLDDFLSQMLYIKSPGHISQGCKLELRCVSRPNFKILECFCKCLAVGLISGFVCVLGISFLVPRGYKVGQILRLDSEYEYVCLGFMC